MKMLLFVMSLLFAQQAGGLQSGSISGQLRDVNGAPAAGVRVATVPVALIVSAAAKGQNVPVAAIKNTIGMEFVKIQPGTFQMGCSTGDGDCHSSENPAHTVRITKSFEIGKYEVTQQQWQAVLGWNPSNVEGATLPVENVTWYDVEDFLKKINARNDGYRYRLPTEAEWEFAARAGSSDASTGASAVDAVAWHEGNAAGKTHPVGQKQPNAWGLHDMQGNVWEWVQDYYSYYQAGAQTDPSGAASGTTRVFRGGSWFGEARSVRVSTRLSVEPGSKGGSVGFRCVREAIP